MSGTSSRINEVASRILEIIDHLSRVDIESITVSDEHDYLALAYLNGVSAKAMKT
jgi:hypothetical protein